MKSKLKLVTRMEWHDLPDEVWLIILNFILDPTILSVRATCRAFRRLGTEVVMHNRSVNFFPTDMRTKNAIIRFSAEVGRWYTAAIDLSNTVISDASAFAGVHTLDLCSTQITDASALGGIHTLDLHCTRVTDASALGDVHTLNLFNTSITDASAL